MALLTEYATDSFVKQEKRFIYNQEDEKWIRQRRNVNVKTQRLVFSSIAEAEDYIASLLSEQNENIKTDGITRRINDIGWAEVVIAKTEEGDWE